MMTRVKEKKPEYKICSCKRGLDISRASALEPGKEFTKVLIRVLFWMAQMEESSALA